MRSSYLGQVTFYLLEPLLEDQPLDLGYVSSSSLYLFLWRPLSYPTWSAPPSLDITPRLPLPLVAYILVTLHLTLFVQTMIREVPIQYATIRWGVRTFVSESFRLPHVLYSTAFCFDCLLFRLPSFLLLLFPIHPVQQDNFEPSPLELGALPRVEERSERIPFPPGRGMIATTFPPWACPWSLTLASLLGNDRYRLFKWILPEKLC